MKKVFISQPMNGLSDLEIKINRERAIEYLHKNYYFDEIMIIDSFIEENPPDNVNSGLWYLGKSLELLASADIVVFAKGWRKARGCWIEFKCANEYDIPYICECWATGKWGTRMNKKLAELTVKKSANYSDILINILKKSGFVIVLEKDTRPDRHYILCISYI